MSDRRSGGETVSNQENRFVSRRSFVPAGARSGCLVEFDLKSSAWLFPFALGVPDLPFSLA